MIASRRRDAPFRRRAARVSDRVFDDVALDDLVEDAELHRALARSPRNP